MNFLALGTAGQSGALGPTSSKLLPPLSRPQILFLLNPNLGTFISESPRLSENLNGEAIQDLAKASQTKVISFSCVPQHTPSMPRHSTDSTHHISLHISLTYAPWIPRACHIMVNNCSRNRYI